MSRRIYIPLLVLLALFFINSFYFPLPSIKTPHIFYSNQSRRDLKQTLLKSFQRAKKNIFISVYTLTDAKIIKALNQRVEEGLEVKLIVDKKQLPSLRKKLSDKIDLTSVKQRGLMHQKIFVIDDTIYIGSSNLTTSSLRMHDNLMLGIFDPEFSDKIQRGISLKENLFPIIKPNLEFYTLPSSDALERVLKLIGRAEKSIQIAMFTFTHPKVFEALKEAKERGVKVRVVLDYLSHKGASRKMATMLKEAEIPLTHNRGMQMMHHKFGFIDEKTLIMGSTNWTKSAFEKNQEGLLILPKLNKGEKKFMKNLWRNLWWESKKIL